MARPVAPTHTLYGKDADRFIADLERNKDKKVPVSATHADKVEIRALLEKMRRNGSE